MVQTPIAARPRSTTRVEGVSMRARAGDACLAAATVLAGAVAAWPNVAFAAIDVANTLTDVMNMLANGVMLLGSIFVVMGLVNLGLSLKDGTQGGGSQLAGALSMIVGGAVVAAAGIFFRSLDTNIVG